MSNLESLAQQTNVVLLTTAAELTDASSLKFMNFLEVGIFLGLILGVGAALIFEMKDKRLREDDDLVRLLGVPVLGRIVSIKPGQAGANSEPASGGLATI